MDGLAALTPKIFAAKAPGENRRISAASNERGMFNAPLSSFGKAQPKLFQRISM
ncbi:hypothetical protein [Azonexus sp.]|uniref:hypothetical protein n=1 Tax=Azonexus sp. TaxID=1872668 RepID=UPI0027B9AC71|nr:hypothetical protein [Azonexus sp.]